MIRAALIWAALASSAWGSARAEEAVGRVNVAGYNARSMCSGALIAPDLVLTAAHCVARADTGQVLPIRDMVFVAGWDGAGHAGAARAAAVMIHPRAFAQGALDLPHDVALIRLEAPLDVPPLTPGRAEPAGPFTLMGYRRSRPHRLTIEEDCPGSLYGPMLRITCAVEKGQSGGPVLDAQSGRVAAVMVARQGGFALVVPVSDWVLESLARR